MPTRSRLTLTAALAAIALTLAGCAGTTTAPSSSPSPTASASQAAVVIPATPAGATTRWVLDLMNAEADTTAADWEGRLTAEFLAEVPAEEIAKLINTSIRPAKPLEATAYEGDERTAVTTIVGQIGEPFNLSISVTEDDKIEGLFMGPATEPREAATSLDEVTERLGKLPGDVRALVIRDGERLVDRNADEAAPTGSVFKLYVLGAVADAVAAGTLAWDETLTVTDEVKSLPSGELQDAPAGTTLSVRDAAEKMISISDNTATDMLIQRVSRDAVETAVVEMGHSDPALMRPFLTTQELFALGWGDHDALAERWAAGDEGERRAVLDELAALPFDIAVDTVDLTATFWQRGMEWFFSPDDIAAAHDALQTRAAADPVVSEILEINPGITIDSAAWSNVAFKGGSSPGVVAGSWYARSADGTPVTIVVTMADDEALSTTDQTELFGLVEDTFRVLAE